MNTYTQLITDLSTQSRGPNKYLKWYLSIMERAQIFRYNSANNFLALIYDNHSLQEL